MEHFGQFLQEFVGCIHGDVWKHASEMEIFIIPFKEAFILGEEERWEIGIDPTRLKFGLELVPLADVSSDQMIVACMQISVLTILR